MNALNLLRYVGTRIYSAELTAAAWLEQRRIARRIMLGWYHRVSVANVAVVTCALNAVILVCHTAAFVIVPLILGGIGYSFIADKSHEVLDDSDRPCHLCPAHDDDNGGGNAWLDWDSQPPAAPPSAPGDDLPCSWADPDDMDIELYTLLQEATS